MRDTTREVCNTSSTLLALLLARRRRWGPELYPTDQLATLVSMQARIRRRELRDAEKQARLDRCLVEEEEKMDV
jgi:hypothetical protein